MRYGNKRFMSSAQKSKAQGKRRSFALYTAQKVVLTRRELQVHRAPDLVFSMAQSSIE